MNLLSRRNLLLMVVVLVAGFGAVHIVHGSNTKKHSHHHVTCAKSKNLKHSHSGSKHAPRKAGKNSKACKPLRKHRTSHHDAPVHHSVKPKLSRLQRYARALIPGLDRAVRAFNSNAASIGSGTFDDLTQSCGTLGTQTQVLEYQVDGIPHPGKWNTPVTNLHFHIMDIFHQMLGATTACATSASNQDSDGLYSAQSDAAGAAAALQSQDAYVHSLAR